MEIEPLLPEKWIGREGGWIAETYRKGLECINDFRRNYYNQSPKLIVNPHKMHTVENGNFVFTYRSAAQIEDDMNKLCAEIGVDGYNIKRLDICFDTNRSYEDTHKLLRLITLMLGRGAKAGNRFESIDPLTLETKTVVVNNQRKHSDTLEIEHYNRELLTQDTWENEPIVNRFEVRRMRQQIRRGETIRDVAEKWRRDFEGLTEQRMYKVLEQITEGLYGRWVDYCEMLGRPPTAQERNIFYSCYGGWIYTREQLYQLYARDGYEKTAVNNLLRKSKYGGVFKLYRFKDVRAEVDALESALERFITGKRKYRRK